MAKARTHFICRSCGSVHSRWMGKCPDCGAWDALERFVEPKVAATTEHAGVAAEWVAGEGGSLATATAAVATPLPEIDLDPVTRIVTGIGEFDRVLGGGLVPGSIILLGGDPGIGKSTLLLQAAGRLASPERTVLYVTSEESAQQVRLRAERLLNIGEDSVASAAPLPENLLVLPETNLARIVEQSRRVQPHVMIIDSVQMIYKGDLDASPGSVTQLRRCATELAYLAKVSGMTIVIVGHVTKDGQLAGPKLLEHLVDTVLSFEGDRHHAHRVVRASKNRFGPTFEVGLFEMTGTGLVEIADAGALLEKDGGGRCGSVVAPVIHGTRCLLVEVQALTSTGFLGSAKRRASGFDANRLAMLIAVLEKHGGLRLADQDVFVSVVGGLKIVEPGADLAVCLAIAGAHLKRTLPARCAAVGEVGLGGELRGVPQVEVRTRECSRCGFGTVIVPRGCVTGSMESISALPIRSISEALATLQPASNR